MDFKFDKLYPPEYAYLEDFVEKANGQLRKMDMFIYRVSDTLKEVPFSWSQSTEDLQRNYRRARALEYLKNKQALYSRAILDIVSQETTGADPRIQFWVRGSALGRLRLYDEQATRYRAQNMDPSEQNTDKPKEKMYKLFSELPSIFKEETIVEKKLEHPVDAITKVLWEAEDVSRMIDDAKKRRQANQHRRFGHRR